MRAVVYEEYGGPEVMHLEAIAKPTPGTGEVLLRVHACSLNGSDWEFLTATPAYVRGWGLLRPKHPVLGSDVAGVVEAVGEGASSWKVGDEVFGDILYRWGGLAEWVTVPEELLLAKPADLSFEEAAALPQAAAVAMQGIRDVGRAKAGERVLINGGGGGCGTFAIQIAKALGAVVTAVDNDTKLESMRALGADEVIDFRQQDYASGSVRYDLILDFQATRSFLRQRRLLNPGGRYLMVGGSMGHIARILLGGPLLSVGDRQVSMLAYRPNESLDDVLAMVAEGSVRPTIDSVHPLAQAPGALGRLGAGEVRGKVVVRVTEPEPE